MSRGESWLLDRFASRNIIQVADTVILRDGLLLDQTNGALAPKMSGYNCFATLICYGPRASALVKSIMAEFDGILIGSSCAVDSSIPSQFEYDTDTLIWAASPVLDGDRVIAGCVLRASSKETRVMREFLRGFLGGELIDGGGIKWDM
jgi:hypothetical protein